MLSPRFWVAILLGVLTFGLAEAQPPAADVLRGSPSPRVKPTVQDLLSGRDCIPLRILLENRPLAEIHSYARPVDCGGPR